MEGMEGAKNELSLEENKEYLRKLYFFGMNISTHFIQMVESSFKINDV
jgi:hypothetical protein